MSSLLQTISDILSEMIDWVGSIVDCITGNPLLLLFVVLPVGLISVGVVRRLIRL